MNSSKTKNNDKFSLLSPYSEENYFRISPETRSDLSIDFLCEEVSHDIYEQRVIISNLINIPTDKKTIAYRNAVYSELSAEPELCSKLHRIISWMRQELHDSYIRTNQELMELMSRLYSLRVYSYALVKINELIKDHDFKSEGLKKLRDYVAGVCESNGFEELENDVKHVLDDVSAVRSITIGVNLDRTMQPIETGIVSLNSFYYGDESIIKNFINFARKDNINDDPDLHPFTMASHKEMTAKLEKIIAGEKVVQVPNQMMNNLNHIITKMLPSMTSKVKRILDKYADVSGKFLTELTDELMFYSRFIELENKIKKSGLPCCIAENSDNDSEFTDLYNIKLAICRAKGKIEENIVCNDMSFTKENSIHILTGPNRGGKTIITQALGLAFIMYQIGVFVPASSASLRPCSGIFSHFPVEEEKTVSLGRLGEESARFNEICKLADSNSLILLNESFATTSHTESLCIAEDVVRYMCCLGTRALFNTHMHELAENTEKFRKTEGAVCGVDSLVMENENGKRSYKITRKKPDGKSYAREIAYKYGITFEQLSKHLHPGSAAEPAMS